MDIKNILLVDNEVDITYALSNALENYGFNIDSFNDPIIALKSHKNNYYDLVILDIKMPLMDGYTAVKEIKLRYPNLPVLAFTAALIDNQMYSSLQDLGFEEAILKPFQPMELFSKIRKYNRLQRENVGLLLPGESVNKLS